MNQRLPPAFSIIENVDTGGLFGEFVLYYLCSFTSFKW